MKKISPKLATFLSILTLTGACGSQQGGEPSASSLKMDSYYNNGSFMRKHFNEACQDLRNDPAAAPASYKQTLDLLFVKAKQLNPALTTCEELGNAFEGRKLDLKGAGSFLELGLIVKLVQPKVVDLSSNELTDEHLTEFGTTTTNGSAGSWELATRNVDLSYNKLTKIGNLLKSRDGVRLLEGVETLNFEGNAITSLDDIPVADAEFNNLKVVNLAKNPVKLGTNAEGAIDPDAAGFRFLSQHTLVYLDISNTAINSTAIFGTSGNPQLLMLNLDGLNFTDVGQYQGTNPPYKANVYFPALIYASARGSKGLPGDFFGHSFSGIGPAAPKLSFLDLTASDIADVRALTSLPELDVLMMAQTKVVDFSSIPTAATSLDVLSVYKTGVTAPLSFPTLGLLDAQKTALVPGSTYVTVQDSCSGPKCMVGPAGDERTTVAANFALCPKDQRKADGSCQVEVGACKGTITEKYDANNLLTEMCCETTTPIYVGEIVATPVGGKICTSNLGELGIYK